MKQAELPADWRPCYKGKHPENGGGYFKIEWQYPWKISLSSGRKVEFKNYLEHNEFVSEACLHYTRTGKKFWTVKL